MLKKLLASALAVATVASCAYVPSALASAGTTYETANAADYLEWSLKNPGVDTNDHLTIYVSGSGVKNGFTGAYSMSVAPADNNADYVKANLGGAVWNTNASYNAVNGDQALTPSYQMNKAERYVVDYVAPAGTNVYIANVVKQRAVVYSTYKTKAQVTAVTAAISTTNADALVIRDAKGYVKDFQLLGYYEDDASLRTNVLRDMLDAKYTSQAVLPNKEFTHWNLDTVNADAKNYAYLVTPEFNGVTGSNPQYYTDVNLYVPSQTFVTNNTKGVTVNRLNAVALTTGMYVLDTTLATQATAETGNFWLPTNNVASWTTALTNHIKLQYGSGSIASDRICFNADRTQGDTYHFAGVRQVKAAEGANLAKYAAVYTKDNSNNTHVDYELSFWDVDGGAQISIDGNTTIGQPTDKLTGTKWADPRYYTTDVAEIYSLVRGADMPADLDSYLASYVPNVKFDNYNCKYKWEGAYKTVSTNKENGKVTIELYVERYDKYDVYSFGPNDSVAHTVAWLSDNDVDLVSYTNKDLNGTFTTKDVIAASAEKLGASKTATINAVPADYAYAQVTIPVDKTTNTLPGAAGVVECTYKQGDATATLADFETATGAFNAEAYFCRDAKAGDVVTLKVSLSNQGVAKKLDLKNVAVKYTVTGNATVGESFIYSTKYATDTYKDGVATEITLAEGVNIVSAVVYYNGVQVATFDPFYTNAN